MSEQLKLPELAVALGVEHYDYLMVGDGSGTSRGNPCGSCVFIHDAANDTEHKCVCGASDGTNNYAELMPYVHGLFHIHWLCNGLSSQQRRHVVIISDSEITVKCGNKIYERKANAALWQGISWFEHIGYSISWLHVRRNTNYYSTLADDMAGKIRKMSSLKL